MGATSCVQCGLRYLPSVSISSGTPAHYCPVDPTAPSRQSGTLFQGWGSALTRKATALANPEKQTQDHDGKKAEEEHQPDHDDDDDLDRPPPAHHAPTNGVGSALAGQPSDRLAS